MRRKEMTRKLEWDDPTIVIGDDEFFAPFIDNVLETGPWEVLSADTYVGRHMARVRYDGLFDKLGDLRRARHVPRHTAPEGEDS
jgi:hypothetical protein